jgi:hypothetical protein
VILLGNNSAINNGTGLIPLLPVLNIEWRVIDTAAVDYVDGQTNHLLVNEAGKMLESIDEGILKNNSSWTHSQEVFEYEKEIETLKKSSTDQINGSTSEISFPSLPSDYKSPKNDNNLALKVSLGSFYSSSTLNSSGSNFCTISLDTVNITRSLASHLLKCIDPVLVEVLFYLFPLLLFFFCKDFIIIIIFSLTNYATIAKNH